MATDLLEDNEEQNEPVDLLAEKYPVVSKQKKEKSALSKLGDYEKSLFLGLGQGAGNAGASILNLPIQGAEYLTGKKLPHVPHPDFLNQYYPEGTAGNIGKSIGNAIGGTAIPVGGAANTAYKSLQALRGAKGVLGRMLASGGAGGLTAAATNEGNRLESGAIGTGLGIVGGAVPEAVQGIGAGLRYLRAPSAQAAAREEQLGDLLHQSLQANQNVESSQLTAAERANQQYRTNLNAERQSKQNIQRLFPNLPQHETNARQVEAITHARNNLNEQFQNRYGEFNRVGGGQKPIREPYQEEEIIRDLNAAGVHRGSTRRMANRLEPHTVDLSIVHENGEPYRITVPAENSSVQDHVEFMRETRDAASEFFRQARNADRAHQIELLERGRALRRMSNDAERRVHNSLEPHEIENFQHIQNDYRNLFTPFNESNTLRNIFFNREANKGLLPKMLQPRQHQLHQYLLQHEPAYRQQFIHSRFSGEGHPLHPENIHSQASNIKNLGRTEQEMWQMLSPEQRAVLTHHMNIAHQRNWIEKFKESITAKPLKRAVNATQQTALKGKNQEARHALDVIEHAQNHEAELMRQAKLLKLPDAEMKKMERQIALLKSASKFGSHALGWSELHNIASKFIK
jgi:hypothetical protein